jgi:phosphoserine phosphatase RsbU/P
MNPTIAEESPRFEQLRRLTEISRALTYTTEMDQVAKLATHRAAELLHGHQAVLMLLDGNGLLQVTATYGVKKEDVARFREPLDETLVHQVQQLLKVSSEESFIGVPLVAGGAVKGLLGVVRKGSAMCTDEEEWLLSAVADQVAVAMETSRLEEEVKRVRREKARGADESADMVSLKDRALATLSHDLRSPLNAIDSYAELMEMEILGPVTDRQREALGRIRFGGRHLLSVLQNVLEMARIEAGVASVQPTAVELNSVIDEAATIVRHDATARDQKLVIETGPVLMARADPDRLRQVLINLLGNAIKYTPPGGTLRISTRLVEGASGAGNAEVSVADNGPGIPDREQDAIFQPYYRVLHSEDGAPEGAGLGLAISRELVRQMGGDLLVSSELGKGSTFTVRLALASNV